MLEKPPIKEEEKLKNKTTIKAINDGYNLNEKRKYTLREYLKKIKRDDRY